MTFETGSQRSRKLVKRMKIAGFKLYHAPASRSVRVKWALHEVVGDAFEVEKIPLYEAAQYSAEFIGLNPNHCVPVLEIRWDDGQSQVMIESAAMVAFLADAYPERGLAPPPGASRERADYLQMIQFGSTSMDHDALAGAHSRAHAAAVGTRPPDGRTLSKEIPRGGRAPTRPPNSRRRRMSAAIRSPPRTASSATMCSGRGVTGFARTKRSGAT